MADLGDSVVKRDIESILKGNSKKKVSVILIVKAGRGKEACNDLDGLRLDYNTTPPCSKYILVDLKPKQLRGFVDKPYIERIVPESHAYRPTD